MHNEEYYSKRGWKKLYISPRKRIQCVKSALEWLAMTTIDSCENGKCVEVRFEWRDRWVCFLSEIETAILGYYLEGI